ncbi:MAG: glycerophosphodiester phosphodiesterase [Gammaproteobacteria bacterium]|nr:glycerophosphodiester phosphodiesterase [Gammaproteobacteria bacterium]
MIIAHRGASGYLPEHTLQAKTLAHEMGADYLEQDVVATRDDELVVLHDIYLDRVSDVATRFPGRARDDGRYYVRDFDLSEIRELHAWERMQADGTAVYPGRYPARSGQFGMHTLREEIELVQRLNRESGREAGIYPEIKRPAWHRDQGVDIAPVMLELLLSCGYSARSDAVFVQCFDAAEVRRLRHELHYPWRLVQLIGENSWQEAATDYELLRSTEGLKQLAQHVDAIGPWTQHLYTVQESNGTRLSSGLTSRAQALGLAVHPYTFRVDELPPGFASFDELVFYFVGELRVDGLFTDFPDRVRQLLDHSDR